MEKVPFERVLGVEVGTVLQKYHEEKKVAFRMGATTKQFVKNADGICTDVELQSGEKLAADIIVLGAGVLPATSYLKDPEASGLKIAKDKSLIVDESMFAGVDGLYAAGDLVRYPYAPLQGELVRIEHWGHSQNQARVAALNMLGKKTKITNIPVFWTAQYGKSIRYAGHAFSYDEVVVDSAGQAIQPANPAFVTFYILKGQVVAVATMGRDPIAAQVAEIMDAGVSISGDEVKHALTHESKKADELLQQKLREANKKRKS